VDERIGFVDTIQALKTFRRLQSTLTSIKVVIGCAQVNLEGRSLKLLRFSNQAEQKMA